MFHINASEEDKYKYLFRLMDADGDGRLGMEDVKKCLWLIYKSTVVVSEKTIKELAEEIISQNDDEDISYDKFKTMINRHEMIILMTMKF